MSTAAGTELQGRNASFDPIPMVTIGLGITSVCILALMIGLASGVEGDDVPMMLWALVTVIIGFAPLALDAGRPMEDRHVFLSMLAIVYTAGFVMPIFVHYIPAVGPTDPPALADTNLWPSHIATGQWIAIIGLLAFYAGYALPIRRAVRQVLPKSGYEWGHTAGVTATVMLVFFGWFVFLGRNFGLIPAALGSGVLGGIANATTFSPSLLMALYLKYRSRSALFLLITIVPTTTLIMFMTGSKRAALLPAAMVVLTWVIVDRRIKIRWIVAGFLALILLYPVAHFWRQDILQANTLTIGDVLLNPGPAITRTGDFLASGRVGDYFADGFDAASRRLDAIGVVSVIVRDTPSVSPFQNGRTLALIPVAYVPRVLWPGKPVITIGQWVTEAYVPSGHLLESNLGTTWVGEFYLNWGVTMVILGMLLLGVMLRFAHEALMRVGATVPLIVAATIVISQSSLALQGGVVVAVNGPIFTMIPLVGVHLVMRFFGGMERVPLDERSADPNPATPSTL